MDNPLLIEPSAALVDANSAAGGNFSIGATANPNVAAPATPTVSATANPNVAATPNPSTAAASKTGTAATAKTGGAVASKSGIVATANPGTAAFSNTSGAAMGKGAAFSHAGGWPAAKLYGAQAAQMSGGKLAVGGLLTKLVVLIAVIPFGSIVAGILLLKHRRPKAVKRVPKRILKRKSRMRKLIATKITLLFLILASVALLGISGLLMYKHVKVHNIAIAAGDANGESYILMKALQTVAGRYYPRIKITINATAGTTENLKRLEQGQAQLVTAQADVPTVPSARAVALLYNDDFQLLVHAKEAAVSKPDATAAAKPDAALGAQAGITHFTDLKGKRIALPKTGGQYKSFLTVAAHFGLKEPDFEFVGGDDDTAEAAFAKGEVDAIFKVRALHNAAIKKLLAAGKASFLAIDDALAMKIESPAYLPANIPKGSYLGEPPVPPIDIPTITVQRLLLARRDVDDDVVFALTQVLTERRQELAAAIPDEALAVRPLVTQAAQPLTQATAMGVSPHPGALAYYDQHDASFVSSHADLLALALAACALIGLWFAQMRRTLARRQKDNADAFNFKVLELMQETQERSSERELAVVRNQLMEILAAAIIDLDGDKLSKGSFQLFHLVWHDAMNQIRDLETAHHARPGLVGGEYVVTPAERESPHASLARMLRPRSSSN